MRRLRKSSAHAANLRLHSVPVGTIRFKKGHSRSSSSHLLCACHRPAAGVRSSTEPRNDTYKRFAMRARRLVVGFCLSLVLIINPFLCASKSTFHPSATNFFVEQPDLSLLDTQLQPKMRTYTDFDGCARPRWPLFWGGLAGCRLTTGGECVMTTSNASLDRNEFREV